METTLEIITFILNSLILLTVIVIYILFKKSKKKRDNNIPGVVVMKNKRTKALKKDKTTSKKEPEYMWDKESNSLVEITSETLEKWRYKMNSKTKTVFDKSKKGGK